jgi:hypothetical protein
MLRRVRLGSCTRSDPGVGSLREETRDRARRLSPAIQGTAFGSHVRPQGATPMYVSLVPAYRVCTAPNSTHGSPLAFPSCRPPVQASSFLTVGTPDSNGAPSNSIGHIRLDVRGTPGPPSDADVTVDLRIKDVRCQPVTNAAVCATPNGQDGPDYTGQIQATLVSRISDHLNGPGLNESATVVDLPFPIGAGCSATSSIREGGVCAVNTTLQAIVPGAIREEQRMTWELGQVQVSDGGQDGMSSTADNTLFAVEGVFVP